MTPLRQRLLDDMRMRNLSPNTGDAYVRVVAAFAKHFGRSPDLLGPDHVREYLLHLIGRKAAWGGSRKRTETASSGGRCDRCWSLWPGSQWTLGQSKHWAACRKTNSFNDLRRCAVRTENEI